MASQQPRQSKLRRHAALLRSQILQALDQLQVPGEILAPKPRPARLPSTVEKVGFITEPVRTPTVPRIIQIPVSWI